jgi:hypothetical protein
VEAASGWLSFMEIKNSQGQIIFECDGDFRKANLDQARAADSGENAARQPVTITK